MNLPLPHLLASALPADAEVREALCLFEAVIPHYEKAFKTGVSFEPGARWEFPAILSTWLLSILQRSRLLAWGIISGINASNETTTALAARAFLENVAYLGYVHSRLRNTYAQVVTRSEMTWTAFRLRFARRLTEDWEDLTEREKDLTKAVNVLTAMKIVDEYALAEHPDTRPDLFTIWYMRLCEFCHPNTLGIEAGTDQSVVTGTYRYHQEPRIRDGAFAVIAEPVCFAQYHFWKLYNNCWGMMIEHGEALPRMTPDSDPRVPIEDE